MQNITASSFLATVCNQSLQIMHDDNLRCASHVDTGLVNFHSMSRSRQHRKAWTLTRWLFLSCYVHSLVSYCATRQTAFLHNASTVGGGGGGGSGAGFFPACEEFGRMCDNSFPASAFIFFFFLKVEIRWRTLIPFLRPGSVHSGSAIWDDCCRVFPD